MVQTVSIVAILLFAQFRFDTETVPDKEQCGNGRE
jgi:hypothetical protein